MYIWNVFGVMVFQRCMLNWSRRWGLICLGYMCIVLYKYETYLVNGFPEIYGWLEVEGQSAIGICALCYIWNLCGVMVFQIPMLDWRRGWGQPAWVYMHCATYIWNLFDVMVFQRSMLNCRRGWGLICHGYICIVLYMKCMWFNGFPDTYAWLEEGMGSICMGIYALCYIYMKLIWCNGFPEIYGWLE